MTKQDYTEIRSLAASATPRLLELRREFHRFPELSGKETRTTQRICEELTRIGLQPEVFKGNIFAAIEGGQPGKTIGVRADFDALPITEDTGCDFTSQTPGVMHACGHDAHTAMLLTAAQMLFQLRNNLAGRVIVCFQFGEEYGLGCMEMIEYLNAHGPIDCIYALHVMSDIPTGEIMLREGPVMAGAGGFGLTVTGKGGHGSSPWTAVDPIKPLCETVLRFCSLPVNRFDVFDSFVISPCVINGGTASNVIPETASIQATVRYFGDNSLYDRLRDEMTRIADGIAASYGATAQLTMPQGMGPVVNDPHKIAMARTVVSELGGLKLSDHKPFMLSDNYSLIVGQFGGFYGFLGVGNPAKGMDKPHHNPGFQLDEDALAKGCEFVVAVACKLLSTAE